MRETWVEDGLEIAPGSTSVASKRSHLLRQIFHWVIQTGLRWPFDHPPLSPRWSPALSACLSLSVWAFTVKRQFQESHWSFNHCPCVSRDEFLMCAQVKKENTMHQHTLNCARNWWSCLQCSACVCFHALVYWSMKVGASTPNSEWRQQLSGF